MEFWDHLFLFKRLYDQTMDPIAQQWDLTRMELDILLFLANAPAYDTAADIVERRRLTKSHVSVSIHSLIRRGWLERSPTSPEIERAPTSAFCLPPRLP